MSNTQLEDLEEERLNSKLAEELGIDIAELDELVWEIDTNSSDDGMIYEYIVTFSEDSSQKVLRKVKGLRNGDYVCLPASFFD